MSDEQAAELTNAWSRSIMAASDEFDPYPGFWEQVKSPRVPGVWQAEPPTLYSVLKDQLVMLNVKRLQEAENEKGNTELWYRMDPEHFSDEEQDARRYSNYLWFINQIDGPSNLSGDWRYEDFDLMVRIGIRFPDGSALVRKVALHAVTDAEKAVHDYPIIDEDKFNELEEAGYKESMAAQVKDLTSLLESELEWPTSMAAAWIASHEDALFERGHETAVGGRCEVPVHQRKLKDEDLLLKAVEWSTLTGFSVHRSIHSTSKCFIWLLRPTLVGPENPEHLHGLLVRRRPHRVSESEIELETAVNVPAHEFGSAERSYVPSVTWSDLPAAVRLAVLRYLREPQKTLDLRTV